MDWAQLLTALLGGGLGGTLLGRFWDNHREDRFRHVEQKRELAAEFLRVSALLVDARDQADSVLEKDPEALEMETLERMLDAFARAEEESNLFLLMSKVELLEKQMQFLFGRDVVQAAKDVGGEANAIFIGKYKHERYTWISSDTVMRYVLAVRRELGAGSRNYSTPSVN